MRALSPERVAWMLLGLLVAFWLWFGVASAVEEQFGWGNLLLHLLLPGGAFAIIAAIAWRWPLAGGALLIAAGFLVVVGYSLIDGEFYTTSTLVFVMLAMAAPPVAAGVLLMQSRKTDSPLKS